MSSPVASKARPGPGRAQRLLAPAVAVMNRLSYPQKFALISLLFVLPLALVTYYLFSEYHDQITFTEKEVHGVRYLRTVRRLFEHAGQARQLAHAGAGPELAAKHAEIDRDLEALEAVDRELGTLLKTTAKLGDVKEDWRLLKSQALLHADAPGNGYQKLLADVRALIAHAGDTSNLILDPDLDSYYLMDLVLLKLPAGQDLLGQPGCWAATCWPAWRRRRRNGPGCWCSPG